METRQMVSALGEEPRPGPGLVPEHRLLAAPRLPPGTGTSHVGLVVPRRKEGKKTVRSSGLGGLRRPQGAHGHHGSFAHTCLLPLWHLVLPCLPECDHILPCPQPSSPESSPQCHSAQRSPDPGTTALLNGLLISNYSALTRMV